MARIVPARTYRASSWQRNGGNEDFIHVAPEETRVLLDVDGPGMITHIGMTAVEPDVLDFRDALIRMYWDNEETPSVEVPFGDFFCVANCEATVFTSAMVSIGGGGDGKRSNNTYSMYFPMPFGSHARIELVNQSDRYFGGNYAGLWYQIDYERYNRPLPRDLGRFHAQWRRENPTAVSAAVEQRDAQDKPVFNLTGEDIYVMLEAEGAGHVAGVFLQVNNKGLGWWGEGDDMAFIDDDTWPPSIHGTGTEEYFGGGPTPDEPFHGFYAGFLAVENRHDTDFHGNNAMYRWYVQDPVRFEKKITLSIEHGHGNAADNDYASVAYWYQHEPHAVFPKLPPIEERWPDFPPAFWEAHKIAEKLYKEFVTFRLDVFYSEDDEELPWQYYEMAWMIGRRFNEGQKLMHHGDYEGAKLMFERAWKAWESRKERFPDVEW